ncbi:MAG: four helix bundle protein [Crocinitomicaceae bacterium]|nr:four helix bundle protein [Crocinitomicaceae bacterium]
MKNEILELTFKFSLSIIEFSENLESNRKFNMANQLFRSGTSIGANVREAQNPQSRADFISKMKIASKEVEETQYWLQLCDQSPNYPKADKLLEELVSIKLIINKIVVTAKNNARIK